MENINQVDSYVIDLLKRSKSASSSLALLSTKEKNEYLMKMADSLEKNSEQILKANRIDVENAVKEKTSESLIDRLRLTKERIYSIAKDVRFVASLADPIGEGEVWKVPNGLEIKRLRVPLGVVAIIYESRPNVTVDVASLCLKTGNSCVLRGSSSALNSNRAIVSAISKVLPSDAALLIDSEDRKVVDTLMHARGYVDVLIPRGGANLIKHVTENATVPVIETGSGNCHIFIDESADLEKAEKIVLNAKTQRPGVCNAAEKLLIHKNVVKEFLPKVAKALNDKKVELRADKECKTILDSQKIPCKFATEEDWPKEYLDLIIGIKVVNSLDEAIAHINKYNTKHTEAILTNNVTNANKFAKEIDASTVMINASTRFTDGGEFGFGAEVGISTQKMHARGPMGLKELTTYKYVVTGEGQVRG
ncbi:MAG: glutamate-5-semialdehyde dehydrogenase [Candidatus Micrarchaeota archaeon]